jgi:hypothetical protein
MKQALAMLSDIVHEKNGYRIGEPWRLSDSALAAVVPILREAREKRTYRLASEVGKSLKVVDTGSIEKLEVVNESEFPLLVKAGELVTGATQTRTLVRSEVLFPGEKLVAASACTYATKGIRLAAPLTFALLSPARVRSEAYAGYLTGEQRKPAYRYTPRLQQKVWREVAEHTRKSATTYASFAARLGRPGLDPGLESCFLSANDDLAGRVEELGKKLKDVLSRIPSPEDQVGMVLVPFDGSSTFETFDHPESWQRMREKILGAEAEKIISMDAEPSLFEFKPSKVLEVFGKLLLRDFAASVTVRKQRTRTYLLKDKGVVGEVVLLDGEPIHATLVPSKN